MKNLKIIFFSLISFLLGAGCGILNLEINSLYIVQNVYATSGEILIENLGNQEFDTNFENYGETIIIDEKNNGENITLLQTGGSKTTSLLKGGDEQALIGEDKNISVGNNDKITVALQINDSNGDEYLIEKLEELPKTGYEVPDSLFKKYNGQSLIPGINGNHEFYKPLIGLYELKILGANGLTNIGLGEDVKFDEVMKIVSLSVKKVYKSSIDNSSSVWQEKYKNFLTKEGILDEKYFSYDYERKLTKSEVYEIVSKAFFKNEIAGESTLRKYNLISDSIDNYSTYMKKEEFASIIFRAIMMKINNSNKYFEQIDLSIPQFGINISPSRTFLNQSSVRLKDLSDNGAGFYQNTSNGTIIIFGHSSVWSDDKNPFGPIFKPLIGGNLNSGDIISLTIDGRKANYEIIKWEKASESNISKVTSDYPAGTKIIIFTCDTNTNYRWIYYAKELGTSAVDNVVSDQIQVNATNSDNKNENISSENNYNYVDNTQELVSLDLNQYETGTLLNLDENEGIETIEELTNLDLPTTKEIIISKFDDVNLDSQNMILVKGLKISLEKGIVE